MRIDIRLCAWAMLASILLIVASGVVGHMAPPPPSTMPIADVAAVYRQYSHQILLFTVLTAIGTTLSIPAWCALAVAMRSMQPRYLMLPILQCAGGVCATMGAYLGSLFIAAAAVRLDTSDQVIAALNDIGVIFIEMTVLPAFLQAVALATAIFRDRSADPILPHWLAWIYIMFGVLAQGGFLSVFFKTGPLAPTGFIGLFLPIAMLIIFEIGTALALFLIKPHRWAQADCA
jgi:hypothetical protein